MKVWGIIIFFYFFLSKFYIGVLVTLIYNVLKGAVQKAQYHWSSNLSKTLNLTFFKLRGSKEMKNNQTIFFLNHTCLLDVFVDDIITKGTCNFLSRYLVGIVFPPIMLIWNTVWLFVRGRGVS